MRGDYRKYTVDMKLQNESFRLWKRGIDGAVCVLESYREKRSVYFAVSNLLPSASLMAEGNREYRLILMGVDEGKVIHRDFGSFFVNQKGEGSFFRKFGGLPVTSYTHCLLLAVDREDGKTETILSGTMPFYRAQPEESGKTAGGKGSNADGSAADGDSESQKNAEMQSFFRRWQGEMEERSRMDVFAASADETGARWIRITETGQLPEALESCRPLIEKYGHYLVGEKKNRFFAGVPGRFLQAEQPCRETGCFALWQPIRGGEKFFRDPAEMSETLQKEIFGYWIGEMDRDTGMVKAF